MAWTELTRAQHKRKTKRYPSERTFAWPGRCRRLAKDWEKSIESAEAWVLIAHIRRLSRLLAKA